MRHASVPFRTVLSYLLVVCVLFLILLGSVSNFALPRLVSDCGRLKHVGFQDGTLTLNHVRLDLPRGEAWKEVDLKYDLEEGEALNFILNRSHDRFQVLRLSHSEILDSAILTFEGGRIRDKHLLQSGVFSPDHAELRFVRHAGGTTVTIGQADTIDLPVVGNENGFEIAMIPPSSTNLFRRVTVGQVILSGGDLLPSKAFARIWRSASLLLLFAALLALPIVHATGTSFERLFPYHAIGRYRQIVVFFLTLIAVLLFFACIPKIAVLDHVVQARRTDFRAFLWILVVWSFGFMIARDRFMRRYPRFKRNLVFKSILFPFVYLGSTAIAFFLLAWSLGVYWFHGPDIRADTNTMNAPIRMLCYGGSSTEGYPFPSNWPFTYPSYLQGLLREHYAQNAVVINLGTSAATIMEIEERLPGDLLALNPTHILICSLTNNRTLPARTFRKHLDNVIRMAVSTGQPVFLVKEPEYRMVYGDPTVERASKHDAILQQAAETNGLVYVDPVPEFIAHREEFIFIDEVCHMTKYGNALLAEIIERAMRDDWMR